MAATKRIVALILCPNGDRLRLARCADFYFYIFPVARDQSKILDVGIVVSIAIAVYPCRMGMAGVERRIMDSSLGIRPQARISGVRVDLVKSFSLPIANSFLDSGLAARIDRFDYLAHHARKAEGFKTRLSYRVPHIRRGSKKALSRSWSGRNGFSVELPCQQREKNSLNVVCAAVCPPATRRRLVASAGAQAVEAEVAARRT